MSEGSTNLANRLLNFALIAAFFAILLTLIAQFRCYVEGYQTARDEDVNYWSLLVFIVCMGLIGFAMLFFMAIGFSLSSPLSAARVGLTAMTVLGAFAALVTSPRYIRFEHGFRDGFKERHVSYAAIRSWRSSLPASANDVIGDAQLPQDIRDLKPSFVCIEPNNVTRIYYGSGFGHWGIAVYPNAPSSHDEFLGGEVTIQPGVYVWSSE